MPIVKSAKKKMRQDIKRTARNRKVLYAVMSLKKRIKKVRDLKLLSKFYSLVDKAAKKKIIHKNKAARLKGRIFKLVKK